MKIIEMKFINSVTHITVTRKWKIWLSVCMKLIVNCIFATEGNIVEGISDIYLPYLLVQETVENCHDKPLKKDQKEKFWGLTQLEKATGIVWLHGGVVLYELVSITIGRRIARSWKIVYGSPIKLSSFKDEHLVSGISSKSVTCYELPNEIDDYESVAPYSSPTHRQLILFALWRK